MPWVDAETITEPTVRATTTKPVGQWVDAGTGKKSTDFDPMYDQKVSLFYNWLKSATPEEREGSALTRFANPLGLGDWLSRKFGTGEMSAWFDALDAYTEELSWSDPEKWKHFLVGAEQAVLTFKGLGAAGVPGIVPKFAAYQAIQAPRKGETLTKRAAAIAKGAAFGFAVGQAGKYLPLARYRIPTTVGGAMLVTKLGGGNAKQVLDAGAQMFGWEVLSLIQQGANRRAIIKAARKHNPELRHVSGDEILRSVNQLSDIQRALPKKIPTEVKAKPTPAEKSGMLASAVHLTSQQRAAIQARNKAVSEWIRAGRKGPPPPAIKPIKQAQLDFERTRSELTTGLKTTKRFAKGIVAKQYAVERAKRAEAFERYKDRLVAKGVPVSEALIRAQRALAGEFPAKPTYEAPRLTSQQWETISRQIEYSGKFKSYEKTRAQGAVNKIKRGAVLQNNEIELLSRILGVDFAAAAQRLQPWETRMWRGIEDVLNFPKFAAAYDVQMARQGAWIRARHPILYSKAIGKNVKGYFSNKQAEKIRVSYESDPLHEQAKNDGVVFIEREGLIPSGRIEQYRTRIAGKLPFGVGRAYKASQRGFVESFNWTQQQLYNYKYNNWMKKGVEITPRMRADLVDFDNTILGMKKPTTNFGAQARRILSPVMWSPTLTLSRITTPAMILTNPTMRGEVAATLSSYIASGLLVMYAASKFNKKAKVEWNPLSTDFGKAIIGNTRFDVFGDGGPYIRTLIQFLWGKKKTEAGKIIDKPRWETIKQFARNKRNAWISAVLRWWTGKMYFGGSTWEIPEDVSKFLKLNTQTKKIAFLGGREVVRTFLPFFLNATVEASYNDGWPTGLAAGTAEFFSQTTVSYKPSKYTKLQQTQDILADWQFDKEWDDLAPMQQEALRIRYKELRQAEQALQLERAKRESDYKYVARQIVEEKKVGKKVYKMLKPELQQSLDAHGITLGLSRQIGDWYMNDDRYKRYQNLTVKAMNRLNLSRITESGLPFEEREQMIRMMVNLAKKAARETLIAETYPKKAG